MYRIPINCALQQKSYLEQHIPIKILIIIYTACLCAFFSVIVIYNSINSCLEFNFSCFYVKYVLKFKIF